MYDETNGVLTCEWAKTGGDFDECIVGDTHKCNLYVRGNIDIIYLGPKKVSGWGNMTKKK